MIVYDFSLSATEKNREARMVASLQYSDSGCFTATGNMVNCCGFFDEFSGSDR